MRVLLSTWGSRGDVEPHGGTRGAVAGTRRGGAGVRAAGLRGAAGPCRRAAGAARPVGARAGARGEAVDAGGRAAGRGRVGRRAVRRGRPGGRGMRRAGGDRPDAAPARGRWPRSWASPTCSWRSIRASCRRRISPAAAAGPAVPAGRDRQPGAVGGGRRAGEALYGAPLNAHRASLGLPPVDNVRDHVFTDHPWLAADPILAPWP